MLFQATKKLLLLSQKIYRFWSDILSLYLIRASGLFDDVWYLSKNPDVAQARANPLFHFVRHGWVEGRDPGPRFCSKYYLETYEDVKNARINPLIHYLLYGRTEGRQAGPPYQCPVCSRRISKFLPISPYYEENRRKYGYPFNFDDQETINPDHYICPSCNASDRERLYALYIAEVMEQTPPENNLALLDIAPSHPLKTFLLKLPNIKYLSADRYMEGVDLVVDITNMSEVHSESFDMFICSHVLEHVENDKKALEELMRILKPGGLGILMVPIILKIEEIDEDPSVTDTEIRWRRFGQYDHVRLYSKKGFIERIQETGFDVNQYGVEHFGRDKFLECGISLKSILYVVRKNIQ